MLGLHEELPRRGHAKFAAVVHIENGCELFVRNGRAVRDGRPGDGRVYGERALGEAAHSGSAISIEIRKTRDAAELDGESIGRDARSSAAARAGRAASSIRDSHVCTFLEKVSVVRCPSGVISTGRAPLSISMSVANQGTRGLLSREGSSPRTSGE